MLPPIDKLVERRWLGDFEILREIGRGGMGVVYEARQVSLNRPVALKVLGAGLGLTPQAVQRFRREAEAAAKLHHTNIVPVYATGEQDGIHFYAMELIEGPALNDVILQLRQAPRNGPFSVGESVTGDQIPTGLPLTSPFVEFPVTPSKSAAPGSSTQLSAGSQYFDTVARLMADVVDAIEYAHSHGVIHRDIKPANLLLAPEGRLSVNDFGLARVLEQPGMTMTGEFVGTPAYMSPEQITAGRTPLDHRTDIFSLGATLYELLTLQRPFAGDRRDQVLAQILHKEPVPPRKLNRKVPLDLQTICLKALEKDPDRRYRTAQAMADDLRRYLNRFAIEARRSGPVARLAKLVRRHKLATTAGIIILLLASAVGVATRLYYRAQDRTVLVEKIAASAQQINWAHNQLPIIEASVRELRYDDAFELLQKLQVILPENLRLAEMQTECSFELTILTEPPGATVFRKPLGGSEPWQQLGVTPIENRQLPRGAHHLKFEKNGFATAEATVNYFYLLIATRGGTGPFRVELDRADVAPQDMVRVRPVLNNTDWGLPNQTIPQYWIDRFEVTNRRFKSFVDQGGYRRQEFWEQPFEKEGRVISWDEAMSLFSDKTGQPGPATWVQGSFPEGQDDFPVSGVSWYEAAAYAKFVGKTLPTVYHWAGASGRGAMADKIVPLSNLEGSGSAPVGQFKGLGPFGTYDMAGNVKEWCWNSAGNAKHFILGGAWDELSYQFSSDDFRHAMDREANMGFRCVKRLPGQEPPPETFAEIKRRPRDYLAEPLLSDDAFRIVKGMFDYDRNKPLKAVVEREEETASWVHQRVAVDTAYGSERLIIHLFLPREAVPPYQSVIYWPHGGATILDVVSPGAERITFLLRSGRALVIPEYKGTYERKASLSPDSDWWERTIQQVKDFSRSIDYLQTRKKEFDIGAIGYYGVSWGAADVRALAIDNRIKAAVFVNGGLYPDSMLPPERHVVNYLPRINIPVLMLNGRFDACFPPKESQEPMFELLGADPSQKSYQLSDSSHVAEPSIERIQETVSWFDRYLGPVNEKARPPGATE